MLQLENPVLQPQNWPFHHCGIELHPTVSLLLQNRQQEPAAESRHFI
jgi:hypothetical protein